SDAPGVMADEVLRKRDEDDRAYAGGGKRDADGAREPLAVPARQQRRARHHAGETHAHADHAADEEIELPEVGKSRGEKEGSAHAGKSRRVHPARPEPIEDQTDERRGEAV